MQSDGALLFMDRLLPVLVKVNDRPISGLAVLVTVYIDIGKGHDWNDNANNGKPAT